MNELVIAIWSIKTQVSFPVVWVCAGYTDPDEGPVINKRPERSVPMWTASSPSAAPGFKIYPECVSCGPLVIGSHFPALYANYVRHLCSRTLNEDVDDNICIEIKRVESGQSCTSTHAVAPCAPDHLLMWSEWSSLRTELGAFSPELRSNHLWSDHLGWILIPGLLMVEGCGLGQGRTHYILVWIWIRGQIQEYLFHSL